MTFSDYAEQVSKANNDESIPQQKILLSNIMMTNNSVAN
jgi:hypothetical protein